MITESLPWIEKLGKLSTAAQPLSALSAACNSTSPALSAEGSVQRDAQPSLLRPPLLQVKSVQLKTLNRGRAEMIIERWLATGRVPTASEVKIVKLRLEG